ncbi:O-antigen ligase family protein [Streptomyces sp. NPDC087212]|uniref:O-antigen ligase family protein n=1 Tax=Streptomyces sp. NPDC087212 TaxID=3365766 RepID=UPI0037FB02E7
MVLGACAAWSLITAGARDGRPEGVLLAVLAVTAGYAAGRISGALLPVAAPSVAALAGLVLTVAVPGLGPQFTAPLGHVGATAALLALGTGAACAAAWAAQRPAARLLLGALAVVITGTAAVVGSIAGFVACAGVLLCSLAAGRLPGRGAGIVALGVTVAMVTGLIWALAGNVLPEGPADALTGQLTEHRVRLWRDALSLARDHAALGVGPGRFGDLGMTVTGTPVPDGKPHSAPLQLAAEQGIVGVVLLGAGLCWILHALWRSPRATPVVLTAGAALASVAAIAAFGTALSFTAVAVGAGLLAGVATAHPLMEEERPVRRADVRARGERLTP